MKADAAAALDAFEAAARPYLEPFPLATCIEQTRILRDCLAHFGVTLTPVSTTLQVTCHDLDLTFLAGLSDEQRTHVQATAHNFVRRSTSDGSEGYNGHVVGVIDGEFLVDPTLSQASAPDRGLVIPREFVRLPLGGRRITPGKTILDVTFRLDNVFLPFNTEPGLSIEVKWITRTDTSFTGHPAWEPSHLKPLINRIILDMQAEL